MSLLARLRKHEAVRAVDLALADTLRRLDPDTDERVLAAAALASLAVGHGHAAFDPAQPQVLLPDDGGWPDADTWQTALCDSRWVSQPRPDAVADAAIPLVLEHGLLYLRRYREYERRLAAGLFRLASAPSSHCDPASIAPLFAALFPETRAVEKGRRALGDDGGQARAAALALAHSLLLITGGPGTGKTTTIARVLLLLLAQAEAEGRTPPRIALAAPTGRAAERMADSLRTATAALRETLVDDDPEHPLMVSLSNHALPPEARTLHRLLGTIPDSPRFRHDADTPLPYDIVVVDEASMVDLPLMCKLVEAVPEGARLILLGDRDQLPSVEAGDVLAAIGDAAGEGAPMPRELTPLLYAADVIDVGAASAARSACVAATPTNSNSQSSRPKPLLEGHRVHLRRGWRQSEALDLAPLADAIRDGDGDNALRLLRGDVLSGVYFHEDLADPLHGATREALLAPWRALQDCDDAHRALQLAGHMRLLTALRDGPQGARQLNARIEEALAGAQRAAYFHGRLLLVTENSYRHGLFNGDIGVCLRPPPGSEHTGDGATLAWFPGGADGVRHFHPATLPAHTGAFAMTVHKAQGSEFDAVWLLLPRHDVRPLSRELLYTAVTRARSSVHLCAGDTVLRAALSRRTERVSGLAHRLNAAAAETSR